MCIGFLEGPHGLFTGNYQEIDQAAADSFRQMGGFDMIGSGRHKIETPEQFASSKDNCDALCLDGLVIIGGDDSKSSSQRARRQRRITRAAGVPARV